MGIIDLAKKDIKFISSSLNGFAVEIQFLQTDGTAITVNGMTAKHNMAFDTDGVMTSSMNVHISVHEDVLLEAGIITRNADDNVDLLQRIVTVKDSTGALRRYSIVEQYPDQTVGLIVLILVIDIAAIPVQPYYPGQPPQN